MRVGLRFLTVKHFYCRYLGEHWKQILLLPDWGVAWRRICPPDGSDKKKTATWMMPSLSFTTLTVLDYCHSSKLRKNIHDSQKNWKMRKGLKNGGEAFSSWGFQEDWLKLGDFLLHRCDQNFTELPISSPFDHAMTPQHTLHKHLR